MLSYQFATAQVNHKKGEDDVAERDWRERKERMEDYKRKRYSLCVACHEAGHYVVADALG
jgi:hypothetical protein